MSDEHKVIECDLPAIPDRIAVVLPDGLVADMTGPARMFQQDPMERAQRTVERYGGRIVRVVTALEEVA